MAENNIFRDDWMEFYLALPDELKTMFLDYMDKHASYQLNDIINELEDLKVIV